MTLRKSKAIKKIKLDMQQQALKHAKTTQLKVNLKLAEHKGQALKSVNSKVKKYAHITAKKLHIDEEKVNKAIDSLVKYWKVNNDGDDKLYLVAELASAPNNEEAALIQVPLKTPIHKKIGFVVYGDLLTEFEKRFPQNKVISQNAYLSHDADDRKLITSLDLILIDYTLYSKLQSKKTCKKAFPFHPQKVPFEVKKYYQITDYNQYINFLMSSTFAHLKNQVKQYIPIARIHNNTSDLRQVMIDFVAKVLAQTKSNSVIHLYLKTNKSIELLIY